MAKWNELDAADFCERNDLIAWYYTDADTGQRRLCYIKEGEKGFYPQGRITNDPTPKEPVVFGDEDEARDFCYAFNETQLEKYKAEVDYIVAQSMSLHKWQVLRDPTSDDVTILKDGDDVLEMSGDEGDQLFAALKAALYPYGLPEDDDDLS